MAKGAGHVRASRWPRAVEGSREGEVEDLYFRDGRRVEYGQLTTEKKSLVKREKKRIKEALFQKLKNVTTPQTVDGGETIEIYYTSKGLDHFCNDAMLNLSGKYFSESSMMRINEILEKSTYIPTDHGKSHSRGDDREFWFTYEDAEGRGVYFKVAWQKSMKKYTLYSVVDTL